jgi:hypothetical protein
MQQQQQWRQQPSSRKVGHRGALLLQVQAVAMRCGWLVMLLLQQVLAAVSRLAVCRQ